MSVERQPGTLWGFEYRCEDGMVCWVQCPVCAGKETRTTGTCDQYVVSCPKCKFSRTYPRPDGS